MNADQMRTVLRRTGRYVEP